MHYSFIVREQGFCKGETKCEEGCVSAEKKKKCPKGMVWADENTCVSIESCLCVNHEGEPLKPGELFAEDDCKECQCIDNAYSCHEAEECTEGRMLPGHRARGKSEEVYVKPSVTPPPQCDENRLVDLTPLLPNVVFNASSSRSKIFSPEYALLNSVVTDTSGGSWAPVESDHHQFLEINLGKQEPVYGVIVKGSPLYDEYVTSYKVTYSDDGHHFYHILNDENQPLIFHGSVDGSTPVRQLFETPIEAQVIRIHPETWNHGISLRVELVGCSEEEISTSPLPTTTQIITYKTTLKTMYCDDEMGLSGGVMSDQQVSTSSDFSPEHSKQHLSLTDESSWQPLTNSPTEWIMFDFLEPRDVTGLATKGGDNGWVKTYTVEYSHDKIHWNQILDRTHSEIIFLGNYDNHMPHVTNFELPINARYIKIIPKQWENNIQMRVELHGCFKPYPTITTTTPSPMKTVAPSQCNYCPGVEQNDMELDACRCSVNLWWDGENCVNRTQCPCMMGYIPYAVGSIFEKEDCSQCVCKIGGVSHCKPKECSPCEEGLKSTVSSTCSCICQPCPSNTTLCPTSNICIDSKLWCDGIQDCPDDEMDCATTTEEIISSTTKSTTVLPTTKRPIATTVQPVNKCPVVTCRPGFKKIVKKRGRSYVSTMISGNSRKSNRKIYSPIKSKYIPKKGGNKKLQRPTLAPFQNESICIEYICARSRPAPKYIHSPDECPPIVCQVNFIPVFETEFTKSSKMCPDYTCHPPPEPDAVCNVTGRTFNTFDNVEYKYDICNHVLARDLEADEWEISLKKNCSGICSQDLIIRHGENLLVLHPDLSVEYNGYRYTVEQTKNIGEQSQDFEISQVGSTLLFISRQYGFWIIWNEAGDVKLGVVRKLAEKVDGLCGYFNDQPEDDKRKPDGSIARTSVEFGDSWALSDDQPDICEARVCPIHLQNKAWEMCNKVKDQSLAACGKVVNTDAFISRCLETICTCLERSVDNHTAEEGCRCQALQSFVVDCLSADNTIDISDWRLQQDCPATCDAPLVYHDCYQRKCEPTCESISDPSVCPKVKNVCFPGCYCPSGYVRREETCIKPSSCRDCECNVLPHLKYVTYDENNFTVTGNCVYVMSRDLLLGHQKEHKFQVLVTNHPCQKNKEKMCVGKCLNVLDPSLFLEWCRKDTCGGHPEQSCAAIEAFAKDCASNGFCINWRNEFCPPKSCPTGQFYDPCGTSFPETCESIKTKNKSVKKHGIPQEGCYCPPDKVLRNDTCVVPKDCIVCDTEGHHPGDKWKKDSCTNCTCEGTSLKCETQQCPDPSTICERGYNAIKLPKSEEECCDKYSCIPEPTSAPTCEPPQKLVCGKDQILKLDSKLNGCPAFICECKPKEECEPIDESTDTPPEPGYLRVIDESSCCPVLNLICKKETCPLPDECPEFYSQTKTTDESKCCPIYSCEPPKNKCIYETEYKADEKGGEKALTEFEIQKVLKGANETWKDGPCRECKCILNSMGTYQPSCSVTDCPSIKSHPDYAEFELVHQLVYGQCCPDVKRSGCKHDGKSYKIGEKWTNKDDYCTTFHCVNSTTGVQKETRVKNCDKKCDVGFKYFEALPESKECCGSCKQVACVVEGTVRQIDEEWQSDDFCINYFCDKSNDTIQVAAVVVTCPDVPEDLVRNYVIQTSPIEGQCCPLHTPVACKVEEREYEIGETWPSPDGDKCKTYKCIKNADNETRKQESVETCKKECKKGFKYVESNTTCCGSCVQVACLVDGDIKDPGESWKSSDNCTTFTCDQYNDQFSVVSNQETCPRIDCPEENTYVEGCCKLCNITSSSMGTYHETFKIISSLFSTIIGKCINFMTAYGQGGSEKFKFFLFSGSGMHESVCSCCQTVEYGSIMVELTCKDGEKFKKRIAVPAKCGCLACGENLNKKGYSKKAPIKIGGIWNVG
nr:hemocytin-like [Leptinotarsa decemlineata]